MNDPINDIIIRIKNGYMVGNEFVDSPSSKYRLDVLKKIKSLKYIKDFKKDELNSHRIIIELLYKDKEPAITGVQIYSKPGVRSYVSYRDIKPVRGGMGYLILSTSKGILTDREAKKEKLGGEALFSIW